MEAHTFWRMNPRQIASDLRRFFRTHIREWHQGRLSSYELLELFGVVIEEDRDARTRTIRVEFAPADGALDRALREGGFTRTEQLIAANYNALEHIRLWIHVGNGGKPFEPQLIRDPRDERERLREQERQQAHRREINSQMFSKFTW